MTSIACTIMTLFSLFMGEKKSYVFILVTWVLNLWLITVTNLTSFTAISAFLSMTLMALNYFRSNKPLAAEISMKFLFISLFCFCLFSMAIALFIQADTKLAFSFTWIALLIFIGSTPFFNAHVDYLDGAPSFASLLLLNTTLIGGGVFIVRLCQSPMDSILFEILFFFAAASLLIPPILALDQQRIGRLIAYLCMTQTGMLLLLALYQVPAVPIFYLHMSFAIPGAMAGIRFWKHSQQGDKNWEDYAGAGRKHPFVGISWLFILSSLAGAPFSLGFWLYLKLPHAISPLILSSIVLSMIPITRLGVFMFGKPTRVEMIRLHQPRQSYLIFVSAFLILAAKIICFWLPNFHELKFFAF